METFALGDKASLSDLRRLVRADLRAADAEPRAAFDCLQALTRTCRRALSREANRGRVVVAWAIERNHGIFEIRLADDHVKEDAGLTRAAEALMDSVRMKSTRGATTISMTKRLR